MIALSDAMNVVTSFAKYAWTECSSIDNKYKKHNYLYYIKVLYINSGQIFHIDLY